MDESIQAHTIDGCTTVIDVIYYFIENPTISFEQEDERIIYSKYEGYDRKTYEHKSAYAWETKVYKISASDLDISKIRKAYTITYGDGEFSIIETRNNQVHILNDRVFDPSVGTIYEIILNANVVETGWIDLDRLSSVHGD